MTSDESDIEENVFSFETDHLALRTNPDYNYLLGTYVKLAALRTRLIKNIDEIGIMQKKAKEDPVECAKLLLYNPPALSLAIKPQRLPRIDWTKYIPTTRREFTKIKTEVESDREETDSEATAMPTTVAENSFEMPLIKTEYVPTAEESEYADIQPFNRGQMWTVEEQRRLEELLHKYPVEDFEMRRFAKIAKALGNRTTSQVASRVQKYFLKLRDAGLPIPGRIPKSRRTGAPKNKFRHRSTTFFPENHTPFDMPHDIDSHEDLEKIEIKAEAVSPNENVDDNVVKVPFEERLLFIMKMLLEEKKAMALEPKQELNAPQCSVCKFANVSKTSWYCRTCNQRLLYCIDCLVTVLTTDKFEHMTHDIVIKIKMLR